MFNNNGAQGGGSSPYDYIGSPQHALQIQWEGDQLAKRRYHEGVDAGWNEAVGRANPIINDLNREREQLILQVQNLQNELGRVNAKLNKTIENANTAIDSWKKGWNEIEAELAESKRENEALLAANTELNTNNEELTRVVTTLQHANAQILADLRSLRKTHEGSERELAAEIRLRERSTIFIQSVTSTLNDLMMESPTRELIKQRFDEHYSTQLSLAMDLGLINESIGYNSEFMANYPTTAALVNVLMARTVPVPIHDLAADEVTTEQAWHAPVKEDEHLVHDDPLDPNYGQ